MSTEGETSGDVSIVMETARSSSDSGTFFKLRNRKEGKEEKKESICLLLATHISDKGISSSLSPIYAFQQRDEDRRKEIVKLK
jgi:hypothetical protein